jgi:hypothetical protein
MTSSAIIHHRPALLEVLQAGSGGGCPRLSARQEPWQRSLATAFPYYGQDLSPLSLQRHSPCADAAH